MDKKVERILYIIIACIVLFVYGYLNRFDNKYILYKLPYVTVIENEGKGCYINKEVIKQYPEFNSILF